MKKNTTKCRERKTRNTRETDTVFVGLDVHKINTHAAVRINGDEVAHAVMSSDAKVVAAYLRPYIKSHLRVVYEAGPTGFVLARYLTSQDIDVMVVAPTRIPRTSNFTAKSDRLDCKKLALYAEKGLLKAIAVPTQQEEADRQLLRIRNALIGKRRRIKQQIKSLLLLHGLPQPTGLSMWTRQSVRALSRLPAPPELRLSLDFLLEEYWHFEDQFVRLNKQLKELMKKTRHAYAIQRLQTHPGVGKVVAMQVLMELNQPKRFENARQVVAFVGLAPRVHQSGDTRRDGAINKTGRPVLRGNLTEGAWAWIRHDTQARKTYNRLVRNTGNAKKAIIAMARKLLIHLWIMLVRQEDYRPQAA